ncbi:MAG: hypothetical protein WD649_02635, partial [Thermoleophilaceae bacterium]
MSHPNDMTTWEAIGCQRGHVEHSTRLVTVELGGPTGYRDLPPIPEQHARRFKMEVWDPDAHPVDGGPYCPAHDAVSETIATLGVWEPCETTLTLAVCSTAAPGSVVLDYGAQIGWFTLLAASCGIDVLAVDADADNLRLIQASAKRNAWDAIVHTSHARVGPDSTPAAPAERVRLVKIDVEGAEGEVVRCLWPSIEAGLVDHLLGAVSPVFAGYYPDLVADLVDAGYEAWMMPPKRTPPVPFRSLPLHLEPYRID